MINNVLDLLIRNSIDNRNGVAFADRYESVTWGEVLVRVQKYATYLLENKICFANGNSPIPVLMNKSADEICVFWAVAYTGNFYVPIDEKMPAERVKTIIDTLDTKVVLCDEFNYEKAHGLDEKLSAYDIKSFRHTDVNLELINCAKDNIIDADPLYTLFTSGSTGIPKGVICNHRSVLNYSLWVVETFGLSSETKMGNQTPLYFSMSILDLYSTLRGGGTLFIIPKNLFMQPMKLIGFLNDNCINTIYWVPSALCLISRFGVLDKIKLEHIEKVLFAGEVMPTKQLNYWRKMHPSALYANLFGPTEITDIGIYYIVDRDIDDEESVPIGKKCSNVDVLVLNEELQEVKKGQIGELYFRGTFLGMGYYGDPQKTSEFYIQNPLNDKWPETVYKTGDLVKLNDNNEFIYMGRADSQIKHMGYRIELGEIENAFGSIKEIDRVCCFLDDTHDKIVTFYSTNEGQGELDNNEMLKALERLLPKYMVPAVLVYQETLPLNANGKINRREIKDRYMDENGSDI